MMRVAISSTILDLPQHRTIARDACLRRRFQPIMSDYGALASGNPTQRSLEVVDSADAYIGIIGFRYGEVPAGAEQSLTELELQRAQVRGIPMYVFVMDDKHPLELDQRDRDLTRVLGLRGRIKSSIGCDYFDSPEALHVLLVEALADLSHQLRGQSGAAAAAGLDSRGNGYVAHPYTLVSATSVIGREGDIEAFSAWCRDAVPAPFLVVTALGGVGKSATVWKWFDEIVPQLGVFHGRIWWSFYEDNRGEAFVRSCLAYTTGASAAEIDRMEPAEREAKLIASLSERPYLVVIDGLERAMRLYANEEPAFVGHEELAEQTADLRSSVGGAMAPSPTSRARARLRGMDDPVLGGLLRRLASIKTSRIVATTRLFPYDLQYDTGRPIPGVKDYRLAGLSDDEAFELWTSLVGNAADRTRLVTFFNQVDNYPLFIRALACEVANYRRAPGNFSAWRVANPGFAPDELALIQRRSHVLEYALRGISMAHFRVLEFLSKAPGSIGFTSFLDLISPPAALFAREYELIDALSSLEDRGLIGWDRDNDKYDMHPIVRAVVTHLAATLGQPRTPREYDSGQRQGVERRDADPAPGQAMRPNSSESGESEVGRMPVVELRVVSGPGAGAAYRLDPGEHVIGRGAAATAWLEDPQIPLVAAVVVVAANSSVELHIPPEVYADESGHGVTLNGEPVRAATFAWPVDALLGIRDVLLGVVTIEPGSDDGPGATSESWVEHNRPPRIPPQQPVVEFRIAEPPTPPAARLGVSWLRGRAAYRARLEQWRAHVYRVRVSVVGAVAAERRERRRLHPDPAELLAIAARDRRRLWERRRADPDYLQLRVGTADLDSEVRLVDPARTEPTHYPLRDVPAVVSLRDTGVVGIAGPADLPRRVAGWLVAQLAVLHSPADVQVCVLTDADAEPNWHWATWLPHMRAGADQDAYVLIGTDRETVSARVADLLLVLESRRRTRESGAELDAPEIVVVFDGARTLRTHPGAMPLLSDGPAFGIYAICLEAELRHLPGECLTVVTHSRGSRLQVARRTGAMADVRADLVPRAWCEQVGRAVALVRDVSHGYLDSGLPQTRLLDLLGLDPPTGESVAARWRLAGSSTEAVVGMSSFGPLVLDLRRDGPHGLVAGTTGSGKSELLQTLIAALAVANRPDAMTFVLIDYKGGAAFRDCSVLPHTVGLVTELDTYLAERALTSLAAELGRRERILGAAGAKDIEHYQELRDSSDLAPLPRLLIAVDEFASIVGELPDFVTGLVNIARRGRSLGLHLILATQRPAGVVSAQIRANTAMRIALRVTDPVDSADVIDVPDAARISRATPGRGYVRTDIEPPVLFQSARVGGRRGSAGSPRPETPWLADLDWAALGRPVAPAGEANEHTATDLQELVAAINAARHAMGIPEPHRPWLNPLPEFVSVDDLDIPPQSTDRQESGLMPVPYGLEDDPAAQTRRVAVLDLERLSHLGVVGSQGAGRSQVLRTIAGMTARHNSSADVQLYGIDSGNHALRTLAELPHCGAVVSLTQTERMQRLLTRLTDELRRRQQLLSDAGFADIAEQRAAAAAADRLPHLLVLLDRWESFVNLDTVDFDVLPEAIYLLLREGAVVGMHLIVSGDRTLLAGRVFSLIADTLLLRLADRMDYQLAGHDPQRLPEFVGPGRAFHAGAGVEIQVAVLGTDVAGRAQADALAAIGAAATRRDAAVLRSHRPFRVDEIPLNLSFEDAWRLRADTTSRPLWGLVGVGGDELHPVGPDLGDAIASFVVAGLPKSGRSTALMSMARSFLASGTEIVIATPRGSPLRSLAGTPGVRAVLTEHDLTEALLAPLFEGPEPAALLIDDAELYVEVSADAWLCAIIRDGLKRQKALVVAGNSATICQGYRGWQADLRKNRSGALLSPASRDDGDIIGVRLPRSSLHQREPRGRAVVHLGDGQLITVQVPLAEVSV